MRVTGTTEEKCPWCGETGLHEFKAYCGVKIKGKIEWVKKIRCWYCKMLFVKQGNREPAIMILTEEMIEREKIRKQKLKELNYE